MTTSLSLTDTFDIEDRDGLIAFVTAHLELDTETAAQVPAFIRLAEYRLNRLVRAPERETSSVVSTVVDEQTIALPIDYRALRQVYFQADNGYPLELVTLNALHAEFSDASGKPRAYAISEQSLQIGPTPDATYTLSLTYNARIPALTETAPQNWLLVSNADAYVYGTLWQACAWLEDVDAAVAFRSELMSIIEEMNYDGNLYRNGPPIRLRSPVVV